jgi:Bacteriophage head to tail connecting protein
MAIGTATSTRGSAVTVRQRYETIRAALLAERTTFDTHWRELAEYLMPRRTRFWVSDRNKGDRRSQSIIDSTPRFAARTLQSGLHAGLTSPARPWMRLTTPDPTLSEYAPVKVWLHTVTQRMLAVFQRSNLYNALPVLYGDMGVFGTAAMAILEDDHDLIRCYAYPLGSYAIGLDERGLATTFVRDYVLTVRQLVEEFGRQGPTGGYTDASLTDRGTQIDWSRFSKTIKTLWDNSDYEATVEVTWIVCPNTQQDARRYGAAYLPWHSCYFERGREDGNTGVFLRESGFHQFPLVVPRWDVTAEDSYGTDCPGMTALGDVKALQIMQKRKAQAVDKGLNPPLVGPSNLRTQKTSLLPGDITYADVREGQQGLRPIHEIRLEGIQHMSLDIMETQNRIRRAFYEDLFLMLASSERPGQPVTAREIEERHEEKLLALGPVLERTNDELLDPLIDRVFAMMDRAGLIPPPPQELHGVELRVEYLSLMAQAQKLVGVVGQDRFLQATLTLAQAWPEVRHKVNVFQAIADYGDMLGVNPKIVRTDEEAQQLLTQEQQAMAAAAQSQQFEQQARGAKALADAPMGGDTALQRVLDGVQSGVVPDEGAA